MKTSLLFLLAVLTGFCAYAQDSTALTSRKLYVQFGATIPVSSNHYSVGNISLVYETRENLTFALRNYGREYKAKVPQDDGVLEKYVPRHVIDEINFSVGKVRHVRKNIALYLSSGPSYVQYEKPYNLKEVPHPGNSWGGFFNSSIYEYEVRKYHLIGWSVRGDIAFIPWNWGGFSLGAVFNYNTKAPNGGLNLNMMVGKLRK